MDVPHRWHEAEFTSCPNMHNDAILYQGYVYGEATAIPQNGNMRDGSMYQLPFMRPSQDPRNRSMESLYHQQSLTPEAQSPYDTDILSYAGSPTLMSNGTEIKFNHTAPTSVPSNVSTGFRRTDCRADRAAKLYPLQTKEGDNFKPSGLGSITPFVDLAELPPIDQCADMSYITPPVQEEWNRSNPFSTTLPRHQQRQRQSADIVLTPPISRRPSSETSQSSSSDEEMIVEQQMTSTAPAQTRIQIRTQSSPSTSNSKAISKSKHPTRIKAITRSKDTDISTITSVNSLTSTTNKALTTTIAKTTQDDKNKQKDRDARLNASRLRARQAHSLVERRYRENLNLRISQLHETLQTTQFGPSSPSQNCHTDQQQQQQQQQYSPITTTSPQTMIIPSSQPTRSPGSGISHTPAIPTGTGTNTTTTSNSSGPPDKTRKSDILVSAMAYIDHAEMQMRRMNHEIHRLNARVQSLENVPHYAGSNAR